MNEKFRGQFDSIHFQENMSPNFLSREFIPKREELFPTFSRCKNPKNPKPYIVQTTNIHPLKR
jgi:hypothetical protein